jgi:hypothetical protein
MIRNVTDMTSSTSTQNPSTAESDFKNQFPHRENFSNPTSLSSSIEEAALPSIGDDEESCIFTAEELNMIMEVDAKIDHDNMLNAFRESDAEAMAHRQEELLLDKRFVAAEQAILSHNLHTDTIPNTYKTAMSNGTKVNQTSHELCVNASMGGYITVWEYME